MPGRTPMWRAAAILLLLLAGAELFGCMAHFEIEEDGGAAHVHHGCLCCCRHIALNADTAAAPARTLERVAPEASPQPAVLLARSIYHPPRA